MAIESLGSLSQMGQFNLQDPMKNMKMGGLAGNPQDMLKNISDPSFSSKMISEAGNNPISFGPESNSAIQGKTVQPMNLGPIGQSTGPNLMDLAKNFTNDVNNKMFAADEAAKNLMLGKSSNLIQAKLLKEEAVIAFDLMLQIRNKLTDCFQELNRVQV